MAIFFSLALALANPSVAGSAAETDWVSGSDLPPRTRSRLPSSCNGTYIEPEEFRGKSQPDGTEPVDISARDALYVADHSTTFNGDVEIRQGARRITSPFITLDDQSRIADIQGPVTFREPGILLVGESATANLFEGTGVIDAATFVLHDHRMRGDAEHIYKEDENRYLIRNGGFTRCDPGKNTWRVDGNRIRLHTDKGYGVARNVTLKVKDIPVAWFPYFRFPINDERQSGFLMPGFGQSSDGGVDLVIPYYFNLAPDYDATYTFRAMTDRGLVHEGQFRYLSTHTTNLVNATYLRKDNAFDTRTEIDPATGEPAGRFRKQDRWLIHVLHDGAYKGRWRSRIQYAAVSDNDFLTDIGGNVGTTATAGYRATSGNNSANRTTPALNRIGSLSWYGRKWTADLTLQQYQNLDEFAPEQYRKLPEFSTRYRNRFSLFRLDSLLRYTYFDKDTTRVTGPLAITGQRALVDARLDMPLRRSWGFLTPSISLIHRRYDLKDTRFREKPDLTTPSFSIDSGLLFDRSFTMGGRDYLQTLEPRLFYLYTEYDDQDELPRFDASSSTPTWARLFRRNRFSGYDRIGDANQISAGISSSLLRARSGVEILRFSIGQTYHFRDRKVIFQPRPGDDPTASSSPVFTQMRFNLPIGLSVNGTYEWDPREKRSNRGNFSLKYRSGARKIINVTYTFTNPEVQSLGRTRNEEESDVSFHWPVSDHWSAMGRWNFGWDEGQTLESLIGVEYNDCCWRFRLAYRRFTEDPRLITITVADPLNPGATTNVTRLDRRTDSGIFLEFQLKGLANLGGRLDTLLMNSIPGYRTQDN